MRKIQITRFLAGLFLALALGAQASAQQASAQSESRPSDVSESAPSKISLADRAAVARAEERVETLRAKLFDLQIQEIELQARLDELDIRLTPEAIHRQLALVGSVRPMDELRNTLRLALESEKARVNRVLELLASSKERLETEILKADAALERARERVASE